MPAFSLRLARALPERKVVVGMEYAKLRAAQRNRFDQVAPHLHVMSCVEDHEEGPLKWTALVSSRALLDFVVDRLDRSGFNKLLDELTTDAGFQHADRGRYNEAVAPLRSSNDIGVFGMKEMRTDFLQIPIDLVRGMQNFEFIDCRS
jgi:hypothetical protein